MYDEASARGYRFDIGKIGARPVVPPLDISSGQLEFEWGHLLAKLHRRDPAMAAALKGAGEARPHPIFRVVPGPVAEWERGAAGI